MVRVAVVGCAHGMLDDIYATVQFINEMEPSRPVELLLSCGDFECMRNSRDLETLACPPKYRAMHAFHQYYSGAKQVPVLTVFVGGNHEASSYLHDLHYGGWVAPNMFYLGAAGCINVGGLRIGGLSGIYKPQDYTAGRFEREPFDNSTMRSIYHVREVEVFQLSHLQQRDKTRLDVFLSHDWPRGVEQYGDLQTLLRKKPFFREEVQANSLGSPAGELLLYQLRPAHWFAAHLHVKFAAIVRHEASKLSSSPPETSAPETVGPTADQAAPDLEMTKFLALDKCLPHREFLQVLDIPSRSFSQDTSPSNPIKVFMDYEWLAILRATHHLTSSERYAPRVPQEELQIEEKDVQWVRDRVNEFIKERNLGKESGEWITDFVKTAPAYGEEHAWTSPHAEGNPQTDLLLEMLKLPHIVTTPYSGEIGGALMEVEDPNALEIDDDDDNDEDETTAITTAKPSSGPTEDPNEVELDD